MLRYDGEAQLRSTVVEIGSDMVKEDGEAILSPIITILKTIRQSLLISSLGTFGEQRMFWYQFYRVPKASERDISESVILIVD